MMNITEKKKQVSEMVRASSLARLMDIQERLLSGIAELPDEVSEEDAKILDAIEATISGSEADPQVKETVGTLLQLDDMIGRLSSGN
ncbi:MAG: hypothetical protein A2941_00320 [Candidatus Yanofskybacteria bacterium RIFCSPLOWO2_01_FULL_49_17]|uniref:Uncharacterized protein n=1 Tax=Candidatus Yanofskybacteria bacterium RIFCSPLOWO2_01_FULL_49_17 TaxID=1802700 RepID=A0A1F8GS66_9BACT|nr:MAG: hypothetical protein A2941_00320 [Candidatus Yanofskybacteria bacterium RIFCSPLOWO2_01_FULL_49_17]